MNREIKDEDGNHFKVNHQWGEFLSLNEITSYDFPECKYEFLNDYDPLFNEITSYDFLNDYDPLFSEKQMEREFKRRINNL